MISVRICGVITVIFAIAVFILYAKTGIEKRLIQKFPHFREEIDKANADMFYPGLTFFAGGMVLIGFGEKPVPLLYFWIIYPLVILVLFMCGCFLLALDAIATQKEEERENFINFNIITGSIMVICQALPLVVYSMIILL